MKFFVAFEICLLAFSIYLTLVIFVIFVIFQVPTAIASNFDMLLAFRFLTGLFGSPVLATVGANIRDMYRLQKQAYGLAIWEIAAVCGPVLRSLVGSFAAQAKGWTWTLARLSGFRLVFIFFPLPETSSNILYHRTRRLQKLTGDETLKCEPEIMAEHVTRKDVSPLAGFKRYNRPSAFDRLPSWFLFAQLPLTLLSQWCSS